MDALIAEIERNSALTALQLTQGYVRDHRDEIRRILHEDDAERVRLDTRGYRQFLDECADSWTDATHMGVVLFRKNALDDGAVAVCIATAENHNDANLQRPVAELNREWSRLFSGSEEQWCVQYLLRKRELAGRGLGMLALGTLLQMFAWRFGQRDDALLWLTLAGGFRNRAALALYSHVGFIVTSLDAGNNPIMGLQVQHIGQRVRRKLSDALALIHLHAADGNDGNDGGDGQGGAGGGGGQGGDERGGGDGVGGGGRAAGHGGVVGVSVFGGQERESGDGTDAFFEVSNGQRNGY